MRDNPRSHGLWEASAPAAPATVPLAGDIEADVAIVGGGYTGLSAALHLAEAGVKVALLEAEEIGFGGSGRNVGLVNAGLWTMPDEVETALGDTYGPRLLEALGGATALVFDIIARHSIDCEAEPVGTLHCAVGADGLAELREREAQWQRRGAAVDLVTGGDAAALVGTQAYAGALFDRRAGTIQPLAYARGLARAAIAAGASVATKSPVLAADDLGNRWRLQTRGGAVEAGTVIVATNVYGETVFPQIRTEIVRLPYFNMATEPLPADALARLLPGRQGAWDTETILSSFRRDAAGRLVFGGVGALRGTGTAIHTGYVRRELQRLFPYLGAPRIEHAWFGQIGMTTDSLPRLHRLSRGILSFSGYNGRGIGPGTVFGKALATFTLGLTSEAQLPLPVTQIAPVPLRKARELYYEVGAQIAHAVAGRGRNRKASMRGRTR